MKKDEYEFYASYDVFAQLCNKKKITPYKAASDTEVSAATLSAWKGGEYNPKLDKLVRISKYFEVPIETFVKKRKKIKRDGA